MSIFSEVQKSNPDCEEFNMIRSIKLGALRGLILEPYTSSLQVSCNYTSAKRNPKNQILPRLPVPKLNDTLTKYLKTVQPFLNDEEYTITVNLVKDFGSQGGVGLKLQSLLEKRAEKHSNWLEEWWLNTAYLEYRDPVVVFSSPGLVFPFRKFNSQLEQLKYAAKTLLAILDYKSLVDKQKIPVDMMGKHPLDMAQYTKIFGTCRIPGEKRDTLSYNDSKYVTVLHNNHIFHVDLWGNDDKQLSENQIVEILNEVMKLSETPSNESVGILTSDNRDNWAKAYQMLSQDKTNKASLTDVERSIVVLCLDAPTGLWNCIDKTARQTLAAAQTIHGGGSTSNGGNRWFDKTVQFIVGADGVTGLTYEHSPAEGQPIAVLTDFIINYIDKGTTREETYSTSPKTPVRLHFNVNSEVAKMIKTAQSNLDRLAAGLELNCFTFDKYGKNFIKRQKLSPDSYLQMAMQYAFYRLHKTPGAHYESAATRMYEGGRTETIRSCSVESIDFAKAMLDPNSSPKHKLSAMNNAIKAHKDYTVQALQGLGIDRHLLGLKLIAVENGMEIPKLYSDVGFLRSAHMRISTSQSVINKALPLFRNEVPLNGKDTAKETQVACKCDGFMCYGPLVHDGYATCYNPRDNDVNFATAAFVSNSSDTNCGKYRIALEQSLQDMHDVLTQNTKSKL